MNILYLAHRIPYPPNKGDKIRSFRHVEYLAKRHQVWCACFLDTREDSASIEPLRKHCAALAAIDIDCRWATARGVIGLIGGSTVTECFYCRRSMHDALRAWSDSVRFDAVVAFSSSMAGYALTVPARRRVLDLCDLDSRKWLDYARFASGPLQWAYRTEGNRLALLERRWVGVFDATVLISDAEASSLQGVAKPGKLHVVPNGVTPPELEGEARSGQAVQALCDAGTLNVGFIGSMDYPPNVDAVRWFVSECWPAIRARTPQVRFRIVGRSPGRKVRKLATVPGVEVVGEVPDAMTEVQRFDVSVAPMRLGQGLQNKVLEAMAAARPVVLTSRAARAIGARHGHEYLVSDDAGGFAEYVVRLLHEPDQRQRVGRAARQFVAERFTWEEALRNLEQIVVGDVPRAVSRRRPWPWPTPASPTQTPRELPVGSQTSQ